MANDEAQEPNAQDADQAETAPEPVAAPSTRAPARAGGGKAEQYHGLGRRKTSVARVLLRPGEGRWKVNGRSLDQYLPRPVLRQSVMQPLAVTETQGSYDVLVSVKGGGLRGQAEAIRLGVARALLRVDEDFRRRLRAEELLTRDPREVERKKPGRPKARKRFQFSKR